MSMSIDQETLDKLCSYIERIERAQKEIDDVCCESEAEGFDSSIIRKVVALRKCPTHRKKEEESLFILYRMAMAGLVERSA